MSRIRAQGLTIEFPLYHLGARSLKKQLLAKASPRLRTDVQNRVVVAALRGLDFAIGRGERVALVGSNGAGKTTLLRTLAGVYEPVAGSLEISGRIGSLIDPAAGMDSWSTGRENIRLRGLYLGMSSSEIDRLEAEVGAFTELGPFLDVPIHGYSAGMAIRLAFGVATAIRPTILLMDEWISAGDAAFMVKAQARLEALVDTAEILVLATHDHDIVARWCNRAIQLEGGRIVRDGPPADVLAAMRHGEPERGREPAEPGLPLAT